MQRRDLALRRDCLLLFLFLLHLRRMGAAVRYIVPKRRAQLLAVVGEELRVVCAARNGDVGVSSRNGHFCTLRESSVHEINNFQATCKARSLSRSHTGKLIVFNAIHRLSYDFFHFVSRPRIAKRNAARLRGGKGSLRALRDHLALVFRYGCQNANLDQCCVACTN